MWHLPSLLLLVSAPGVDVEIVRFIVLVMVVPITLTAATSSAVVDIGI